MVSENLFKEPSILSEKKCSSSILGPVANFKTLERNFVTMAQVDSLSKASVHLSPMHAQDIGRNEKISNHSSNSNDLDDDFHSSDIELTIEDSDDKEVISENEDNNKNILENSNAVDKDVESLESLDNDLTNTAHLVRKGFSADEFDHIDSLDAVDNAANHLSSRVSTSSNPTGLDDRGKSCDSGNRIEKTVDTNDNFAKDKTNSEEDNRSGAVENQQRVGVNSTAEVERNNNTAEKVDKNEELVGIQSSVSSNPLSKSTAKKIQSDILQRSDSIEQEAAEQFRLKTEPRDESPCSNVDRQFEFPKPLPPKSEPLDDERSQNNLERVQNLPTQSENNSLQPAEEISQAEDDLLNQKDKTSAQRDEDILKQNEENAAQSGNDSSDQVERMSVNEDSASKSSVVENIAEPVRNGSNTFETVAEIHSNDVESKRIEAVSNTDSTPEVISINDDTSNTDKSSENRLENDAKNIVEMSVDIDSTPTVISIDSDTDSNENRTAISEKNNEDVSKQPEKMSIDSDSSSKPIPNGNIDESNEKSSTSVFEAMCKNISDLCAEDIIQETQTCDTDKRIDSLMVVDEDADPKTPESAEIIDSVESEIVELDDDEEIEDVAAVSQNSQQKFNQLFETTAEEITRDEIGAEEVLVGEDPVPSTSGLTSDDFRGIEITLDRLMPSRTDTRKRKQDDGSLEDSLLVEKRAKISKPDTSDSCTDTRSSNHAADRQKKAPPNRARKHTSSTNVVKTFQEIKEKKLQGDFQKRNTSRESVPVHDIFDEFDFEVQENDAEITNETRCNDAAADNPENNFYKIKLNYDAVSKDNLKNIFEVVKTKLTRRQLEEIVIQKCCEMISDSNEIGTLRRQVADLQQAEMFRKQKILNLEKQISQLKAVCQRYLDQVKENPNKPVTPIKITRSVGLQVARGDSSPYVNFDPNQTVQKGQEKLKKLLSVPAEGKKPPTVPEPQQNTSRQRTESPLPSSINHKNNDNRMVNGNARINSPLSSSGSPTPCSSPSIVSNSRSTKKITNSKPTNDAPVIDLTDKDDKSENETAVASKNVLATVNGTVVTYVPMNVNQDRNRQIIKPGTPILINGQLMTVQSTGKYAPNLHPASVPPTPAAVLLPGAKPIPPRPILKIDKNSTGIMLAWEFPPNTICAEISKYQLFAYQETNIPPRVDLWKAVGDVNALPLPMACTLTQFVQGYKYHFIVRAVDVHNRYGPFSVPRTITL